MITLNSISKIHIENYDEIWLIVRSANKVSSKLITNPNVKHVPELSPETKLFYQYLNWKKNEQWNADTFKNKYVPEFINEIKNEKSIQLLNTLVKESQNKNIALACFCPDEQTCHRSIVGGILMNMGANINCNQAYKEYKVN